MINRRNIVWQVPLLLLITFPFWKVPVGDFLSPRGGYDPNFIQKKGDEHNFVLDKITILQTQNGKKTAEIRADTAHTGQQPDVFILSNVNADIIDAESKITNITAKKGRYNTRTKKLILINKVVVFKPSENYRLFTNRLIYHDATRLISCPGPTRLLSGDSEVKGSRLDYDIERGAYKVGGRVYCTFRGFVNP